MKKSILSIFILCSACAYSQNIEIVLGMLQNAKDSIAANKFNSASRILDGASVYGILTDSISYWRNEMKKRGIMLSFEKYKERSFDLSISYFEAVLGKDSNEVANCYWMAIAPKMRFMERLAAVVELWHKVQTLGQFIQQKVKRKISKEEYVKILKAILEVEEMKRDDVDATFLQASQDETTKKWGFTDDRGVLLIPYEYDEVVEEFKNGIAIVKQDSIYGFLHLTGLSTFNMSDASSWNPTGNDGLFVTPNVKVGEKTVKDFFEEIQDLITY